MRSANGAGKILPAQKGADGGLGTASRGQAGSRGDADLRAHTHPSEADRHGASPCLRKAAMSSRTMTVRENLGDLGYPRRDTCRHNPARQRYVRSLPRLAERRQQHHRAPFSASSGMLAHRASDDGGPEAPRCSTSRRSASACRWSPDRPVHRSKVRTQGVSRCSSPNRMPR